jgi:Membrane-associated phospholipid phosphatase
MINPNSKKRRLLTVWIWTTLVCLLLFILLVLAIRLPQVLDLDRGLIRLLDPLRTTTLVAFFTRLTDFGATNALELILAASVLFLMFRKRLIETIVLLSAFLAERQLNEVLKTWVRRERPDFSHLVHAGGYSFPSGHAMNAVTVYGLMIVLIAPLIPVKWLRAVWIAACLIMIFLIGFSRPFLRVHYFTDILAGYSMGGAGVAVSALIVILVEQRRRSH